MANIRHKQITKLEEWNAKELRKLRITINNRISSLQTNAKPKELPEAHPLKNKDVGECNALLEQVILMERKLAKG